MYDKNSRQNTIKELVKAEMVHKRENLSEETRRKMSEAHKGENHPMYGKHHTEETR